ncbi:sporulation protein [Xylariomycetidae sp. FL2044]|nr:sporulation protein [Xylariomycetidae sp. FL2044]
MAPFTTLEEAHASKRKRDLEEQGRRVRAKRDRGSLSKQTEANRKFSSEIAVPGFEPPAAASDHTSSQPVKREKKHRHRHRKGEQNKNQALAVHRGNDDDSNGLSTWRVSQPMGGRILNIDPILTVDEKHLILAYNTTLQVYSTADSLLLRQIWLPFPNKTGGRKQIVSACLSKTNPTLLWVASASGHIWKIDWTSGQGSTSAVSLECEWLCEMTVDNMKLGRESCDVLFVAIKKSQSWHLVACDTQNSDLKAQKNLLTQPTIIQNVRSAHNGRKVTATTGRDIHIGTVQGPATSSLKKLDYEIYTFDCSDEITCLDLRVTERIHLSRKSEKETGDEPVLDIAVGCARGPVFFYNDLLPQIRWLKTSKSRNYSLQPRKYHWHRKAVHAVKWSRDGNYIISGGSESTLVLWQLDTQRLDFLPHLSSTIVNISVSHSGAAYVLHLDDNSAMILSTAEMKPTTYISGIQTLLTPPPFSKDDLVRRIGQTHSTRVSRTPAAVSPSDPSRILLCVGNGQRTSYSGSGPSTPLIQTLDLTTMHSVSKQALTRTNPTDINVTATGHMVTEPRITGLAYSRDGRWLATTDEWQPPSRDVNSLEGTSSGRREVYLKFWSVSDEDQSLELVTRIDAPHYTGLSEPIFDVSADPNIQRFATVGEDGALRLWQPMIRQRDGVLTKDKSGRQLHSWTCTQVTHLQEKDGSSTEDTESVATRPATRGSGSVAFSEDGSILVCAISNHRGSAVYVIDTESGEIRNSLDNLVNGDVQGIGVLSTYLIVLSDTLVVYDMVFDELCYGVQLRTAEDTHGPGASLVNHLALDHQSSRFAVAVSRCRAEVKSHGSELAIFVPELSDPELVQKFPHPVTTVVPSVRSSGFLVLDSAAQLWSISENMDSGSLAFAQPLADLQLDNEMTDTDGPLAVLADGDDGSVSGDEMDVDVPEDDDDADADEIYPAVVPPQKLAELFDRAPPFAMPPIEDMFYQVTRMFSSQGTASAA